MSWTPVPLSEDELSYYAKDKDSKKLGIFSKKLEGKKALLTVKGM